MSNSQTHAVTGLQTQDLQHPIHESTPSATKYYPCVEGCGMRCPTYENLKSHVVTCPFATTLAHLLDIYDGPVSSDLTSHLVGVLVEIVYFSPDLVEMVDFPWDNQPKPFSFWSHEPTVGDSNVEPAHIVYVNGFDNEEYSGMMGMCTVPDVAVPFAGEDSELPDLNFDNCSIGSAGTPTFHWGKAEEDLMVGHSSKGSAMGRTVEYTQYVHDVVFGVESGAVMEGVVST